MFSEGYSKLKVLFIRLTKRSINSRNYFNLINMTGLMVGKGFVYVFGVILPYCMSNTTYHMELQNGCSLAHVHTELQPYYRIAVPAKHRALQCFDHTVQLSFVYLSSFFVAFRRLSWPCAPWRGSCRSNRAHGRCSRRSIVGYSRASYTQGAGHLGNSSYARYLCR